MRIALFTDSFYPSIGGTENAVYKLASALSKEHEVAVFAPDGHNKNNKSFPFKVFRAKSIGVTKNDFWAFPYCSKKMKDSLEEFNPDVVHSHTMGMMASFANAYAKKKDIPSICTVHTKFRHCYREDLKSKVLAELLLKHVIRRANKADRVCSVSNSMIDELKSYGLKKRVTVIRNGNQKPTILPEKPDGDCFKILYVGAITEYKNIRFSLGAVKLLKEKGVNFRLELIGRGRIKKFQKYAQRIGVSDCVDFVGAITNTEELNEKYRTADLLLFTSLCDSDGLVVLEAGNLGTPSLVLEGTAGAERITDGVNGFVEQNSLDMVANRLKELSENKDAIKRVGKNAHTTYQTWEEIANSYCKVYAEEIEKSKSKNQRKKKRSH